MSLLEWTSHLPNDNDNELIFSGITEIHDENTERVVRVFLKEELDIDIFIEFGNVHRFGRGLNGRPRPIAVRFLYRTDLSYVKDRAGCLNGTPYGISEQFPLVAEKRGQKYNPVMSKNKEAGYRPKIVIGLQ